MYPIEVQRLFSARETADQRVQSLPIPRVIGYGSAFERLSRAGQELTGLDNFILCRCSSIGQPVRVSQPFEIRVIGHAHTYSERIGLRSEERRVGKECRSRWSPYH